jgi:ABC-type branched-subunit amino acid transport system substrate-binding protein
MPGGGRKGFTGKRARVCIGALAALALIAATGCGSRLSDSERDEAIAALTGGGGGAGTTTGGDTTGTTGGTGATTGTTGGGTTGGTGATTGTTGGGTTGGATGGGTTGGAAVPGGGTCANATKATDTGLTANKMTVATLADVSGVQPGLFQSAHQGARAAAAYINSQGGICGRQVDPLILDSKTDSGGNRSAMLEACQKAFAVAGSMSAFDDGSAAPGQACGIPDITAITTNSPKYEATNTFPVYPNAGPSISNTSAKYIAKRFPNEVKKAAILWLNQAVTKNNATARKKVWESAGFTFVYEAEVQVLEANYTRFVQEMRSRGVQYVTMVADFQNIVRLQKAMNQQGYTPKVRDWDSVAYDPDYLKEGDPVEGSFVFLNNAIFEESATNPEMKLYQEWLQRAAPGAIPDYFGLHAWSAYRLLQKIATQIGPELTRKKMLAGLKATKTWDGNGLHGPHQTGAKLPTVCNLYVEVKGGKFVRMAPASKFDCTGSLTGT